MTMRIEGLQGMQYIRDGSEAEQRDYAFFNEQYASSSEGTAHDMRPSMIVQAKDDDDVMRTIQWARTNKVAIAIKTGGHQYSGASSTSGNNIQLDLSSTYTDLRLFESSATDTATTAATGTTTLVYAGVSNQLKHFNEYLTHHGLFVPHGLCSTVCLGGHGQSGGVGQLARAFGLFIDHIRAVRLITHDASIREITAQSDPDLFFALLGGSPGNFGVITHYTIEAHKASSYIGPSIGNTGMDNPNGFKGPHGIKALWIYTPSILRKLLTIVAAMSDDDTMPRGFDLTVSVMSTEFPITHIFPSLRDAGVWETIQDKIKQHFADEFLSWLNGKFPASIILYASWCPTGPEDRYDDKVDDWFQQFRDLKGVLDGEDGDGEPNLGLVFDEFDEDMAKMSGRWIMDKEREFDLPYVKRAYNTNSTTLSQDGWVDEVLERIDLIYNEKHYLEDGEGSHGRERFVKNKLVAQMQVYGGRESRFYKNQENGTSYSWRDSRVVQVLDCFHEDSEEGKELAEEWQRGNDEVMTRRGSKFSDGAERAMLWGSYGDWDLSKRSVWGKYFDGEEKYRRIARVRGKWDPEGTWTANVFSVPRVTDQ